MKMMLQSVSRILSRNFYRRSQPQAYGLATVRHKSSRSSESPTPDNPDAKLAALEDVVHSIIVNRAAPEWLPFRPGTSYWAPSRPSGGIGSLLNRLSDSLTADELDYLSGLHDNPCSPVVYTVNSDDDDDASEDSKDTSMFEAEEDKI